MWSIRKRLEGLRIRGGWTSYGGFVARIEKRDGFGRWRIQASAVRRDRHEALDAIRRHPLWAA